MKVVSLQNQVHKKNAKSLNPGGTKSPHTNTRHVITQQQILQSQGAYQQQNSNKLHEQLSESSQITIKNQSEERPSKKMSDSKTHKVMNLNGSGNLNASLKIGPQQKSSTKSQVTRSKDVSGLPMKEHAQTMPSTVIPSKLKVSSAVQKKKSQDLSVEQAQGQQQRKRNFTSDQDMSSLSGTGYRNNLEMLSSGEDA